MNEIRWLCSCGALAAGEFVASFIPACAYAWPFFALFVALIALFGFGKAVPGWRYAALFLLGAGLFLLASVKNEDVFRLSPWLRGRRAKTVQQEPVHPMKRELSRRIGLGLEHDRATANLNRAILLGERRQLPAATRRAFVESGTVHVLAISGLHVMIVAKVLMTLMVLCMVPVRWAGAAAIPLLWGYVLVIGLPPSSVRAAMMATFYCLAPVFWRRPNTVMAWALTFLIVYGLRPQMIADVGCALSFAVMLAIILAGRIARCPPNSWRMTLWLTLAAWAAGVPIAAHVFGRVTPGGLLAGIPVVFAVKYTVVTGVLGLLASFVSEPLAIHLNNLSALFTRMTVMLSDGVARLPFASFDTGAWSFAQCAEWYALVFLVLYVLHSVRSRHVV